MSIEKNEVGEWIYESDYSIAMKAAGAEIILFKEFGSYQGDWWAKIKMPFTGIIAWITGSYGSCTHCDAFQSEFGWRCDETDPEYKQKLARFGQKYLDQKMSFEEALEKASENLEWDYDAEEMVKFIKENE